MGRATNPDAFEALPMSRGEHYARTQAGTSMDGLSEVSMRHSSRQVRALVRENDDTENLILDAPYQRPSVWTVEQRVALIKSVLQGLPINAIFLNTRSNESAAVYVVDGKQRIETLRAFVKGEFGVPASWVPSSERDGTDDDAEVRFSQFSVLWQRKFIQSPVASHDTQFASEEEEAELYHRLNFGGTPHVPSDSDGREYGS